MKKAFWLLLTTALPVMLSAGEPATEKKRVPTAEEIRAQEKANAEGAEERGEAFDARASLADAESALSVIKRSLDGCKTATEWSKSEIAKISSGRDV